MTGDQRGWFHLQLGNLGQWFELQAETRHFGGRQWYFLCPAMRCRGGKRTDARSTSTIVTYQSNNSARSTNGCLRADGGAIIVQPNVFARKGSGSYYTPDELVSLIINRTIGPLVDERLHAFDCEADRLTRSAGAVALRLQDLAKFDPASAILNLKICDPAMGLGTFPRFARRLSRGPHFGGDCRIQIQGSRRMG
jgi:hypothetical protein